ncbi:hypothetical protein K1719_015565 [Acacia pycnantha]|nr:hypothetical protein K1719_015565 [Acacia pycnantha]
MPKGCCRKLRAWQQRSGQGTSPIKQTHEHGPHPGQACNEMGADGPMNGVDDGDKGGCGKGLLRNLKTLWAVSKPKVVVLAETRIEDGARLKFFHFECSGSCSFPFFITAIYAIPHTNFRERLWEDLLRLSRGIQRPWAVLGDFNDIASVNERIGGKNDNFSRMQWFRDRLAQCGLSDIGHTGPKMAWKGPRLVGCFR